MKNTFFDNSQIVLVSSFSGLVSTNFQDNVNAICWERNLVGDFAEIVSKLQLKDNITEVTVDDLATLQLSENGKLAREIIVNDLESLTNYGALPSLNLLKNYERDDELGYISTDVYSYHVDRSPIATSTFLCTYHGSASDILANDEATQKILIPEIREKLKELHNNQSTDFETFLKENYFDLHYEAKQGSKPINLGLGHLWRLAVDHPEQRVLPCVHRAPIENNGELRLLLIC